MLAIRALLSLIAGIACTMCGAVSASAQAFPSRPITMVVPVAPGGQMDAIGRILGERMSVSLGQRIIVENVTGAAGTIGLGRVAHATPDGYTISYGAWASYVARPAILTLSFDVIKDFAPVALTTATPWLIASKKDVLAKDLKGLIAWLKANPDKVSAGTSGAGGPGHVAGVLFQRLTDTRFQFVPYRGTAPAMQDLVAGQIDFMIADPVSALPQFRDGRIKIYAVLAKDRLAAAPDIPTVDELGLSGLYMAPWQAIFAPKGTPRPVIDKLNAAAVEALANPDVRRRFNDFVAVIPPRTQQTPDALAAYHKAEIDRWWPIIKAAGIKP
ncbi:MAG: Bug family tripartite tricarboxylate transporter substrate binding protein [Xanthobacteraceae bacterium]